MKKIVPLISLCLPVLLTFSACETSGGDALAGAATGAAIGGLLHGRGSDALAGAAIGAASGYVIGKVVKRERAARERRYAEDGGYYDESGRYPVAEPTNHRGFVTSPYAPYNLIDVRGLPHGSEVVDPSTDRIFINP